MAEAGGTRCKQGCCIGHGALTRCMSGVGRCTEHVVRLNAQGATQLGAGRINYVIGDGALTSGTACECGCAECQAGGTR